MYETLLRLYKENRLTNPEVQLSNAVLKGWITETQKQEILAS